MPRAGNDGGKLWDGSGALLQPGGTDATGETPRADQLGARAPVPRRTSTSPSKKVSSVRPFRLVWRCVPRPQSRGDAPHAVRILPLPVAHSPVVCRTRHARVRRVLRRTLRFALLHATCFTAQVATASAGIRLAVNGMGPDKVSR